MVKKWGQTTLIRNSKLQTLQWSSPKFPHKVKKDSQKALRYRFPHMQASTVADVLQQLSVFRTARQLVIYFLCVAIFSRSSRQVHAEVNASTDTHAIRAIRVLQLQEAASTCFTCPGPLWTLQLQWVDRCITRTPLINHCNGMVGKGSIIIRWRQQKSQILHPQVK